jgi:hypothetical protein
MKNILLFILLGCTVSATAQFKGFKLIGVGLTSGVDQDMIRNMDLGYFDGISSIDFSAIIDDVQSSDYYSASSMICENPHYRLDLAFAPTGANHTELRLSASLITNRVDMISYHGGDHYLNFMSYTNEVSVGATYLKHATLLKTLRVYGGLGTNVGYGFGHDLWIDGDINMNADNTGILNTGTDAPVVTDPLDGFTHHYEEGPNSISQRLFLQGGLALRLFDRVELGLNYRYGVGYRYHVGASPVGTNLHSAGFTIMYKTR